MLRIRSFLVLFWLRFDSDKWDLTQTWLRYLNKKKVDKASAPCLRQNQQRKNIGCSCVWQIWPFNIESQSILGFSTCDEGRWRGRLDQWRYQSISHWWSDKDKSANSIREELWQDFPLTLYNEKARIIQMNLLWTHCCHYWIHPSLPSFDHFSSFPGDNHIKPR